MAGATLLPDAENLELEALVADEAGVEMLVRACRPTACCPDCGVSARRRHSWYRRRLGDLPWQGLAVRITLLTRRWFCDAPDCTRHIFTERFPTLVPPHGRRTARLATLLTALAFALGGRPGARLLAAIGPVASHDTLINAIRRAPEAPAPPPRVLGVDDWSYRRGKVFGTILVDLERRRPIDLLPDRTAASLAAWLKAHPGVEIIARDRGGAYADGARRGAPGAVQVADRFHLVKNLGEALERLVDRQQTAVRAATRAAATAAPCDAVATAVDVPPTAATAGGETRAARERAQRHARRQARYAAIHTLHADGLSRRAIAAALGLARETVATMLRAAHCPQYRPRTPQATILRPYEDYLRERWAAGERNAATLWREVRAHGFTGSAATVRLCVGGWRTTRGRAGPRPRQAAAPPDGTRTPTAAPRWRSPRQVAWLLRRPAGDLSPSQQRFLAQLPEQWPAATAIRALAQDFDRLIRDRDAAALAPWLIRAEASGETEFREFAAGLRRDLAAVTAALTEAWSSGQVEGQVNRLKSLKRTMFGRANVDLLRRRVLGVA